MPEIDVDDVVGRDPRAEIDRLLPHQLHQLGAGDAVPGVRRHVSLPLFVDSRVEVFIELASGKPRVVFDFGRESELAERQSPLEAVLFDHGPFDDQRPQIGPRGVNRRRPAGRSGTNDDNPFCAFAHSEPFLFVSANAVQRTIQERSRAGN